MRLKLFLEIVLSVAFILIAPIRLQAKDDTERQAYLYFGTFGSAGSDMESMSNSSVGFGWNARLGWRFDFLGLFAECQRDFWLSSETEIDIKQGVFNAGGGLEVLLFEHRVRLAVSSGTSTLLFDTAFHRAKSTGYYIDIHAADFRWPIGKGVILEFAPLNVTFEVPVVSQMPLKRLEYRSMLGLEVSI